MGELDRLRQQRLHHELPCVPGSVRDLNIKHPCSPTASRTGNLSVRRRSSRKEVV